MDTELSNVAAWALARAETLEEVEAAIRTGLRAHSESAVAEMDSLVSANTDNLCAMLTNAEHAGDEKQAAIAAAAIVCTAIRLLCFASEHA